MIPKKKETRPSDLSALELAVMNVIWELGECGSREVIEAYNAKAKRRLADTTIRTVMTNLRKKGYLEPVPTIERGIRFLPAVNRESTARRMFRQLISPLFGGSPSQAIAHLIKHEAISDQEIEEIQRMIESLKKGRPRKES